MQYPVAHSTTLRVASFTLLSSSPSDTRQRPRLSHASRHLGSSSVILLKGSVYLERADQQKQKQLRPTSKTNYGEDKQLQGREKCLTGRMPSRKHT